MSDTRNDADEGGESACIAHLICPECGVVLDGADHLRTWDLSTSAHDPKDVAESIPDDVD